MVWGAVAHLGQFQLSIVLAAIHPPRSPALAKTFLLHSMLDITFIGTSFVAVALFIWYLRTEYFTVIGPVFWYFIFHLLVFVLRPIGVIYFGFDNIWTYMRRVPTDLELAQTLLVATTGLCVFVATALASGGNIKWEFRADQAVGRGVWRTFIVLSVLVAPFCLYSLYINLTGQVSGVRDVETGIYIMTNSTGYIVDAQVMLLPMAIVFLVLRRFKPFGFVPLAIYLSYVVIFVRARWQLIVGLLASYLLYCALVKRRVLLWPVLVAGPMLLLAFWLKGLDRTVFQEMVVLGDTSTVKNIGQQMTLKEKLDTQDFANFDYLSFVIAVVPAETHTYTYFTQWLQLFTEPIPRILWKNKPIGAPIQFFELMDYGNFIGLTVSIIGDGWMSLGWAGVVITMGAAGFFLGRIHRQACAKSYDPLITIMYCILTAVWFQFYRDGGISIFKFGLFAVGPVLVLQRIHRSAHEYVFAPTQRIGG